jgi:hypothetical protein
MELLPIMAFSGLLQCNGPKGKSQAIAPCKAQMPQSQYFGTAVSIANDRQPVLRDGLQPPAPAFAELIEPHISKARARRQAACDKAVAFLSDRGDSSARRESATTAVPSYTKLAARFPGSLCDEADLSFDTTRHKLKEAFCEATRLGEILKEPKAREICDLSQIHLQTDCKDAMLANLCSPSNSIVFQEEFDCFVRTCIAPTIIATDPGKIKGIYYQSFPCIRIIRPKDFSIGPHADVAYGHSPFSINVYIPLTDIYGTSSLYLESCPGLEDWHPIIGTYGDIKRFPGALSLHWTLENFTPHTRISLDFRVLPDYLYEHGGIGQGKDVFATQGYYSYCEPDASVSAPFVRHGGLCPPDFRCGFPFRNRN